MGCFLKFLGFIFLILIAAAAYEGWQLYNLQTSALAYVRAKQPAIIDHWDETALLAEADPKLLEKSPPPKIHAMFAIYARLGDLVTAQTPSGRVLNFASTWQGKSLEGIYVTQAKFEHGDARITLHLLKTGASWKIAGIYVTSEILAENLSSTPVNAATPSRRTSPGFQNPLDAPGHK